MAYYNVFVESDSMSYYEPSEVDFVGQFNNLEEAKACARSHASWINYTWIEEVENEDDEDGKEVWNCAIDEECLKVAKQDEQAFLEFGEILGDFY